MRYYLVNGVPVCGEHVHAEIAKSAPGEADVTHQGGGGPSCALHQGASRRREVEDRREALRRAILDLSGGKVDR